MYAEIAIVMFFLVVNGFFAMSELAIVSSRRARLRGMLDDPQWGKGPQIALDLADDPSTFLAFVQIGMTLISVFAGAFSGATLAERFGGNLNDIEWIAPHGPMVALFLTVACVTYFNLIIGELVPKRIGLANPEVIAVRVAPTLSFLVKLTLPIVWLLRFSTDTMLKVIRLEAHKSVSVTEDEVKDMIAEGTESGVFKVAEKSMLESVMRLSDRTVRSIMTPRIDMVWLGTEDSPEEHADTIKNCGYSRLPVATGDMEDVVGIVYAKDLLNQIIDGGSVGLSEIMRPPFKVPDTAPVFRLLEQFKESREHLAIVIDEYGSVEGLVSLRDILEAITGEIPEAGQDGDDKPVRREDGSWLIDGMMAIDEVESLIGQRNMRDGADFHTIAGFVIEHLGRMPATGDRFEWNHVFFEVIDMDARRIDKVLIHPQVLDLADES